MCIIFGHIGFFGKTVYAESLVGPQQDRAGVLAAKLHLNKRDGDTAAAQVEKFYHEIFIWHRLEVIGAFFMPAGGESQQQRFMGIKQEGR